MIVRALSALAAVGLIILVTYFFQAVGLYALCSLVVFGCIFEYSKLTLRRAKTPLHFQISFVMFTAAVFLETALYSEGAWLNGSEVLIASLAAVLLLAMAVIDIRKSSDLAQAFKVQSAALLGIFYVGLFPGYAIALLGQPLGLARFFGLLGVVFAGDTFAYLTGRLLGRHKLLESVSPKKTIEGSLGGLVGSALAGFVLGKYFLIDLPMIHLIVVAIVSGAFAQIGDLFESSIKRLADVKDSGRIMPGHGGFLDRLDGVLFAAPVFYLLLKLIS